MCKLCEINPVYEFTNKRKLCKKCFIEYFQKKILYTIRKFNMIKTKDIVTYKKHDDFKGAVLRQILDFASSKMNFQIVNFSNKRANKTAVDSSLDSEAEDIIKILINKNISELKKYLPVGKNIIKPLYLFLDEEILLYAKLKNLKFKKTKLKKDRIKDLENEFEKKHPEVKRAIVSSLLEIYK